MPCPYPDCGGEVGVDELYCGTCGRALDPAAVTAWLSSSAGTFPSPGAAATTPTSLLPPVPATILPPPPSAPVSFTDNLSEGQTRQMPPAAADAPPTRAMVPPPPPLRRAPTTRGGSGGAFGLVVMGTFVLLIVAASVGMLLLFGVRATSPARPTLVVVVPATQEAPLIVATLAPPTALVPTGGDPPRMALAEFKARYDDPGQTMLILDVRTAAAYKEGHIKGAISFPEGDVDSRVSELPQERLIVAYCQ